MTVHRARNGEVELAYETFGPPDGEPLLLIMGNMCQMVWWPEGFCAALAERGFHVARFDNRDSGLSTHFHSDEPRHPARTLFTGERAYTSADVVEDAMAVLDALGRESAHLVGGSLGGMIAQHAALRHPERVDSLTSMAAAPGNSKLSMARHFDFATVLRMLPRARGMADGRSRQDFVEAIVAVMRMFNATTHPFDEELTRGLAELSHDRHPLDPTASQRQASATIFRGDLADIRVPALVLHGESDPVLRVGAAYATAKAVPGARLVTFPGMGHFMPPALWTAVADEIATLADRSRGTATSTVTNAHS